MITVLVLFLETVALSLENELFDPTPAWPLCGRITEAPPAGWSPDDGCPAARWGNSTSTDFPLSSTFGPRQKASEGYRYDFHRGIDIPTPTGTPLFAISDGVVKKAGSYSSYSDPLIQIRHYRPGFWGSCWSGEGCYVSNYMHVSDWVVSPGETVEKGQLIGYTGVSVSGFPHLHFEIRNSPGTHDAYSAWQRDCIHPLKVLPFPDSEASNMDVQLDTIDLTDPESPKVSFSVEITKKTELDLERVEVELYERLPYGTWRFISQPGDDGVGQTMDDSPYYVDPSWYDMEVWNRAYTYKNSGKYPWDSFLEGGEYESPFWAELPSSYSSNVHLDQASPDDSSAGSFNGVVIRPGPFNTGSSSYNIGFTFEKLEGIPNGNNLCIKVRALDVFGHATPWEQSNCS